MPLSDLCRSHPPFVFGRPIPGIASGSGIKSLGTNGLLYQLIAGEPGCPLPPQIPLCYCNIREVALAHVLALKLPKLPSGSDVEEKRFLVAAPGIMLHADAEKMLLTERPALKDRFPTLASVPPLPGPPSTIDTTRAREVLGIKEYIGAKETLLETIDALLEVEKTWQ